MRTKTLLLTAALGIASAASSMAQAVYSVNAVGYVNKSLPVGFSIIANPLNATPNTVAEVMKGGAVPGMAVYKFETVGGYLVNGYNLPPGGGDAEWDDPTQPLAPGEGAFVSNPGPGAVTITFVGEVPQGTLTTPLNAGFTLVGSKVPQEAALQDVLGFPAVSGDTIYRFRSQTEGYLIHSYQSPPAGGPPEWDDQPTIGVAEGFFSSKAAPASWVRTFSVNP
jgi:hypothetical protein